MHHSLLRSQTTKPNHHLIKLLRPVMPAVVQVDQDLQAGKTQIQTPASPTHGSSRSTCDPRRYRQNATNLMPGRVAFSGTLDEAITPGFGIGDTGSPRRPGGAGNHRPQRAGSGRHQRLAGRHPVSGCDLARYLGMGWVRQVRAQFVSEALPSAVAACPDPRRRISRSIAGLFRAGGRRHRLAGQN